MKVSVSIVFGDLDNPDEAIVVSNVVHPDVLGDRRLWPYACRRYAERLRSACAKAGKYGSRPHEPS